MVIGICVQGGYHKCWFRYIDKIAFFSVYKVFERYEKESKTSLDSIMTGNETWMWNYTLELKRHWLQRFHTRSSLAIYSVRKIMALVFWDRNKILLINLTSNGTTINATVCCKTLRRSKKKSKTKEDDC